jgi:hypothetical protein
MVFRLFRKAPKAPTIRSAQERAAENIAKRSGETPATNAPDTQAAQGWATKIEAEPGTLSAAAPLGASLRRVASKGPQKGFEFSQVDVRERGPVSLGSEPQTDFHEWLSYHDASHTHGAGFGSVAAEVLAAADTEVARGLIRCVWDEAAGTLDFDHAKNAFSPEDAAADPNNPKRTERRDQLLAQHSLSILRLSKEPQWNGRNCPRLENKARASRSGMTQTV